MSPFAHVTGWGMAVPEKILTNDDLARIVDTNDEWIVAMTGIHRRHIAEKGETTASLATKAAVQALAMTELEPDDIDLVIVATSTPEHLFPATACLVQDALGASRAGAFDLSAACSGFIFALNMATQSIRTGAIRNAMVIGSETLSRMINWEDRSTCILFGDGAGALLLQASERPGGVLACVMRSDGSGGELLSIPAGGSRYPVTAETLARKMHTIHMNGREVFRFATRVMATATKEAAARSGLRMSDISLDHPPPGQSPHHRGRRPRPAFADGEVRGQHRRIRQHLDGLHPDRRLRGRPRRPHPAGGQRHHGRLRCRVDLGRAGAAVGRGRSASDSRAATPANGAHVAGSRPVVLPPTLAPRRRFVVGRPRPPGRLIRIG